MSYTKSINGITNKMQEMRDKILTLSDKILILKINFLDALGAILCNLFSAICSGTRTKLKGYKK